MHGNTDVDNHAGAGTATGRSAWVTGAGSGIGRALALRLAGDGWNVAVSARTARDLATLAAEAPGRIHAFPLDVTDAAAVLGTVSRIEDALGPLDLAVLNAGSYPIPPMPPLPAAGAESFAGASAIIASAVISSAAIEPAS